MVEVAVIEAEAARIQLQASLMPVGEKMPLINEVRETIRLISVPARTLSSPASSR